MHLAPRIALSALLVLVAAAPASAATLARDGDTVTFLAADDVPNDVTATETAPGDLELETSDDPVELVPAGCVDADDDPLPPAARVSCAGVATVEIRAGDRNDRVDARGLATIAAVVEAGGDDDEVGGGDAADRLSGGAGNDLLFGGRGTDVLDAGTGFDTVRFESFVTEPELAQVPQAISLDDAANDGGEGEDDHVLTAEAVTVDSLGEPDDAGAAVTGDGGFNVIETQRGDDVVDGGLGPDLLSTRGGSDTIDARDGFADQVLCGPGSDTALVDQFDHVSDDCEDVQIEPRPSGADDAPPTVSWVTPAADGARLLQRSVIRATATDDNAVAKVEFLAGARVLCVDIAAPFECTYEKNGADVGHLPLTAVAHDDGGQSAVATRTARVARIRARAVSVEPTRRRDTSGVRRFTVLGRLVLPRSVDAADGCAGKVHLRYRSGGATISSKLAGVRDDCSFRATTRFRNPSRFRSKTLRVLARFEGNEVLRPRAAKRFRVRVLR